MIHFQPMGEPLEDQTKTKKEKMTRFIAIVALVLLSINFAYTLIAYAAPGLFHLNNPDFAFAYNPAVFGTTYVSGACSFNTLSVVGTGSLFDFSNFYWDISHATWPRFGFGCDTLGQHMNITLMTTNVVHVYPSAVGVSGRLWAPDMAGVAGVTGAASWSWDATWHVVTFESTWFAPEITVTFAALPCFYDKFKYN